MNKQRMMILGLAGVAALVAAFLVRALLGGGTQQVKAAPEPPRIAMSRILVASSDVQAGQTLTPAMVHWQQWPNAALASGFITETASSNLNSTVAGTVARAPIGAGEPVTSKNIVHSDSAGFMAATLSSGMRAVSIGISTETGAGGFILPNDRVDVILSATISESPKVIRAKTILTNVRVLAVDQTYTQDKDQKVVLAKTATLELSPDQAEQIQRARALGTLSLSLRPLGDSGADATVAGNIHHAQSGDVQVIRYGMGGIASQ